MRPLSVEFSAFGPYPGTQRLDFEQLPAGTLFLVHGPTGSGKTTILDAICFALFGDTSGKERDGADMRCQLAASEVMTEVVLDFALGEKRLRVRRVPDQLRPKQRGEGLTEQKKDATLWSLDAAGEAGKPIATGWGKVTKALEGLIGLDSAQFRQVVLLPQGQFRKLLTSDSRDREVILQRLFDTQRFRDLEDALRRKAAEMSKAADAFATQEETIVTQAARTLAWEGDEGAAPSRAALEQAQQALSKEIEVAAATARATAESARKAGADLQAGEATQRKLGDLETASAREAGLAQKRPQMDALQVELDLAQRAETVAPEIARRARAASGHQAAEKALDAAIDAERSAVAAIEQCAKVLDQETGAKAEDARDQAAHRLTTLLNLREIVGELGEARQGAKKAAKLAADTVEAESRALELVSNKDAARRQAETDRAAAALAADGRAEFVAALEQAQRLEESAQQLVELREREARARESREAAASELADAETSFSSASGSRDELAQAFETGQAARLAATLREGEPCPVCGAADHPQPAQSSDELPTQEEVEAADEVAERARAARDASRDAVARADEAARVATRAVEEQAERAPGEARSLESSAAATRLARENLSVATRARDDERAAATRVETLAAELDETRTALEAARSRAEAARQTAATKQAELRTREDSVPEELRAAGALDEAIESAEATSAELKQRLDEATQAHSEAAPRRAAAASTRESAGASLQASAGELKEADAALTVALNEAGFDHVGACQSAGRSAARRAELEKTLKTFERETVESAAELLRCEAAARDLAEPDLEALRAAKSRADLNRTEADGSHARLDERSETARQLLEQLDRIGDQRRQLEERFGVVGKVARLAVGNNELKLSLHRFVLGALLDEVLDVASVRLAHMSGGRYVLRRVAGLGDGRRAAGLDLEVEDSYSGRARPVATLSGGESFLAALALALSLAQVVQEHAGGVRLDALFIDEGFGSLDQQALEDAIGTLETLGAEGGRLVGVISHVTELAQRIPTRLEVTADPRGSSARFITG